jgi:hypothetical protein
MVVPQEVKDPMDEKFPQLLLRRQSVLSRVMRRNFRRNNNLAKEWRILHPEIVIAEAEHIRCIIPSAVIAIERAHFPRIYKNYGKVRPRFFQAAEHIRAKCGNRRPADAELALSIQNLDFRGGPVLNHLPFP